MTDKTKPLAGAIERAAKNANKQDTPTAAGEHKNVFAAILAAQRAIDGVVKDAKNTFHNYRFASSELVLRECRRVLLEAGIVVVPKAASVENDDSNAGVSVVDLLKFQEGRDKKPPSLTVAMGAMHPRKVKRIYHVHHPDSGTLDTCVQDWTIHVENGRDPSKALAVASTTMLAYFLRDLLALPRVNSDDEINALSQDEQKAEAERAEAEAAKRADIEARRQRAIGMVLQLAKQVGYDEKKVRDASQKKHGCDLDACNAKQLAQMHRALSETLKRQEDADHVDPPAPDDDNNEGAADGAEGEGGDA